MSVRTVRKGYLDWLRGVAVLVMIEAHLLDSWPRFPDSRLPEFTYAIIVGGFGAPLFLFLAGVAVPLSAGSKLRRSSDLAGAGRAVAGRGVEIFGLAFLFRAQAWILGWGPARSLLKVDILNIMGPLIAAAAILLRSVRSVRARYVVFALATAAATLTTPLVRSLEAVRMLPDPIEAYIRPVAGLSNFVFFPWIGFVFAGALVGLAPAAAKTNTARRSCSAVRAASRNGARCSSSDERRCSSTGHTSR